MSRTHANVPTVLYRAADGQLVLIDACDAKRLRITGEWFPSRLEARVARQLYSDPTWRNVRKQVTFPLYSRSGTRISSYRADFVVTYPDGRREIREVKGHNVDKCKCQPCTTFRMKRKWMAADYPQIRLVIVR